jgi:transcriptional regulator with GAF, ATPase, and Fis domain
VGAQACLIVTENGLRVLARDREEGPPAALSETGASARISVPVREGRSTIGHVVVCGEAAEADRLRAAALLLSALVALPLRADLNRRAVAERGRGLASEILGHSPPIRRLREVVVASAATAFPVLVEGESGTGKELVARAIHRLSARKDRPFCAVNCAALPDELLDAELFGHSRGAFTGAVGPRAGLFEAAHGGTLFLDEVGDLSPRGQAKLLRALQEREVRRLGENVARAVDVRLIGATNVSLADRVRDERFREDLRFRLAVLPVRVPAVRDRIEDVPLLACAFWTRLRRDAPTRAELGAESLGALCRYPWPGNVRELQNVLAALVVTAPTRGWVRARHVARVLGNDPTRELGGTRLDLALRGLERHLVAAALARHGGRRTSAARELGLSRQGLTKAVRRLGLDPARPADVGVA